MQKSKSECPPPMWLIYLDIQALDGEADCQTFPGLKLNNNSWLLVPQQKVPWTHFKAVQKVRNGRARGGEEIVRRISNEFAMNPASRQHQLPPLRRFESSPRGRMYREGIIE